jgi:hypothetical protein
MGMVIDAGNVFVLKMKIVCRVAMMGSSRGNMDACRDAGADRSSSDVSHPSTG